MSATVWAALAVAVAIGGFVQGTIGVGFALVVAPLCALVAPQLLPAAVLILMLPLNLYVIARERHAFVPEGFGLLAAGRIAGTAGGLALLALLGPAELKMLVGIATIAAALATLAAPAFRPSRSAFVGAGLVTGVTETATGIGGPVLALVFQHAPGPAVRVTVASCFLVGQVVSLVALGLTGRLAVAQVAAAGWLLPALALGAAGSRFAHRRADGPALRLILLGFSVVSGAVLLVA